MNNDALMVARDALEIAAGMSFDAALSRFIDEVNDMQCEHSARMGFQFRTVAYADPGRRYVRVWRGCNTDSSKSAYFFVDSLTGDILKPASWKGPAKGARGNIFTNSRHTAVGPYGAAYLR